MTDLLGSLHSRRDALALLAGGATGALFPGGAAWAEDGTPFSRQTVLDLAQDVARRPFQEPAPAPAALTDLDYDVYRQIRYRKAEAIWGASKTRFSIELFAPGFLYRDLIDISVVENGRARPLVIAADSFDVPDAGLAQSLVQAGKFAGFRLHYPLNRPEYRDEVVVFQGASYFRAASAGQIFGLSARGLAIDTAQPDGEEFPLFRRFWIERPSAQDEAIVVHALLDSESVAGAYRFGIYPSRSTAMEVEAALFPRRTLDHVGLAPLTSMFLFGSADGPDRPDYRPAVHDSEGLAVVTGHDEAIWRPLMNPATLQVSALLDRSPKGFGLIQRSRAFAHYPDLEADYGRRPSAWVEPRGDWADGHVELVEIPTDVEINDNIVAYWQPKAPIPAGSRYDFAYRLSWPNAVPYRGRLARVTFSGIGQRLLDGLPQAVLDYDIDVPAERLTISAAASAGSIREVILTDNPKTGGVRALLTFDPDGSPLVELRVQPRIGDTAIGETWLYRWLAA